MCMYVCMYVCAYACIHTHVHTHIHVPIYANPVQTHTYSLLALKSLHHHQQPRSSYNAYDHMGLRHYDTELHHCLQRAALPTAVKVIHANAYNYM